MLLSDSAVTLKHPVLWMIAGEPSAWTSGAAGTIPNATSAHKRADDFHLQLPCVVQVLLNRNKRPVR